MSSPASTSRSRTAIGRALLVVISIAATLVLFEGALRLYFYSQGVGRADARDLLRRSSDAAEEVHAKGVYGVIRPSSHPDLVYELRPNLTGTFRGETLRTNSHAMRSAELERRKPADTFRIVGLGDSYMFGWGVAQGETYLELVEQRLKERADPGRRYETLNFGTPGYNGAMQAALYEHRGRHFEPDLVVVHFVGNDFGWPHFLQAPRGTAPRSWYLVDLALAALGRPRDEDVELLPHDLGEIPDEQETEARSRYEYMIGEEGYTRAMEKLAALTRGDSIPVVMMLLGDRRPQRQHAIRVAEANGFTVIDASEHFLATLEREGLDTSRKGFRRAFNIRGDGHPTPLAHQAYADTLMSELERRRIVARDDRARIQDP